jgi:hypothetical protein
MDEALVAREFRFLIWAQLHVGPCISDDEMQLGPLRLFPGLRQSMPPRRYRDPPDLVIPSSGPAAAKKRGVEIGDQQKAKKCPTRGERSGNPEHGPPGKAGRRH